MELILTDKRGRRKPRYAATAARRDKNRALFTKN